MDDLDGTILDAEAVESITFVVDGRSYQVDLSTQNARAFREVLASYVKVARSTTTPKPSPSRGCTSAQKRSGYDLATVRAWAQEQSLDVSLRGRVSNAIFDAYNVAHRPVSLRSTSRVSSRASAGLPGRKRSPEDATSWVSLRHDRSRGVLSAA